MYIRQRKTQNERDIGKVNENYRISERDIELICEAWWNGSTDKECAQILGLTDKKFEQIKDVFRRKYDKLRRQWERDRILIRGREKQLSKVDRLYRSPLVTEEIFETLGISGWTVSSIAKTLGVKGAVLYDMFDKYPKLRDAYDRGRKFTDARVMAAMFKRAIGMSVKKVKFATHEGAISDSQDYYEELPPDTNAAMNWLINRMDWVRNNESQGEGDKGEIIKALEELTKPKNGDAEEFERFEKERTEYD